jgi:hypothetical protein
LEAALAGDGVVFMPAAAGGDERAVVLCASFDGVPMVTADKHVYVPCDWMAREFPEIADLAQKIERRVRAHFGVPR